MKQRPYYFLALIVVLISAGSLNSSFILLDRMGSDEGLYAWYGKRIFSTPSLIFSKEITAWHPPLFSVFLALAHIILPSEIAIRLVPFIFFLVGIVAIYLLGKEIKNEFVGLLCATTLAFNFYYFYFATEILIDVPLTVFFIIFVLFLKSAGEKQSIEGDMLVSLWGALTILLKWSGIIVIPWMVIFYLIGLSCPFKEKVKRLFIALSLPIFVVISLVFKNYIQWGSFSPYGPRLIVPFIDKLGKIFLYLMVLLNFLFPFFIIGIFCLFKLDKPKKIFMFSWLAVFILCLPLSLELKLRYWIVLLPCLICIAGLAIESIIGWLSRFGLRRIAVEALVIIFLSLSSMLWFSNQERTLFRRQLSFAGYKEAGHWVKLLRQEDSIILAGSERQMRYYADINYQEFGGQIVPFRQSESELKDILNKSRHVLLVLDQWQSLNPSWIYSKEGELQPFLEQLGFKIRHVVRRPFRFDDAMAETQAIIIYEYTRAGDPLSSTKK